MLKNTLSLIFRGLRRDIGFSAINLIGLAIGLASCLLILLFVTHELSYDKQYSRAGDIHRVVADGVIGGSTTNFAIAPFAAIPEFRDEIHQGILGRV
jgi:putative ABC transport system permease protein